MATMQTYLALMAGGAVGVAARFWMSNWIAIRFGETFPWGTLLVNVTGSFLIGLIAAAVGPDGPLMVPPLLRQVLTIGLLGGFTTFSSFSLQTLNLLIEGEYLYAGLNVAGSVILCLLAVWAGMMVVQVLPSR